MRDMDEILRGFDRCIFKYCYLALQKLLSRCKLTILSCCILCIGGSEARDVADSRCTARARALIHPLTQATGKYVTLQMVYRTSACETWQLLQ